MIELRNKQTGQILGEITPEQLQFLRDRMEVESADDQDYYINEDELAVFEEDGADPRLVQLLRGALDENGEAEVAWAEV